LYVKKERKITSKFPDNYENTIQDEIALVQEKFTGEWQRRRKREEWGGGQNCIISQITDLSINKLISG